VTKNLIQLQLAPHNMQPDKIISRLLQDLIPHVAQSTCNSDIANSQKMWQLHAFTKVGSSIKQVCNKWQKYTTA